MADLAAQDGSSPVPVPAPAPAPMRQPAGDTSPAKHNGAADAPTEGQPPLPEETAPPLPDEEAPPLPDEEAPPLPDEAPPDQHDDGWYPQWDATAQAWLFINRLTGQSQWENPRVPEATTASHAPYARNLNSGAPGLPSNYPGAPGTYGAPGMYGASSTSSPPPVRKWGGYNPAIHGSYDPNADYAREASKEEEEEEQAAAAAAAAAAGLPNPNAQGYVAQAHFNRFTGKFQQAEMGPDMHNDENKSRRQLTAFFDVDAAANSHDGRSLKAERRGKTLNKKELKAYKDKRRDKKEEKRRAWLLD